MRADSLRIVPWHGETKSLFYVVDVDMPDAEQPAIVACFEDRAEAEAWIKGSCAIV